MTIGKWFNPIAELPVSSLARMTAQQVEAFFARFMPEPEPASYLEELESGQVWDRDEVKTVGMRSP